MFSCHKKRWVLSIIYIRRYATLRRKSGKDPQSCQNLECILQVAWSGLITVGGTNHPAGFHTGCNDGSRDGHHWSSEWTVCTYRARPSRHRHPCKYTTTCIGVLASSSRVGSNLYKKGSFFALYDKVTTKNGLICDLPTFAFAAFLMVVLLPSAGHLLLNFLPYAVPCLDACAQVQDAPRHPKLQVLVMVDTRRFTSSPKFLMAANKLHHSISFPSITNLCCAA